jgi:glycosyltransferase involved in cell wall biosynthesis
MSRSREGDLMRYTDSLVSVGLPVRNGAERIAGVVKSVLTQDHENLELVICDNASTDDTEELCRELAAQDSRIVYHRHPTNVGILNNFQSTLQIATAHFFRWVSDDDWLANGCISRCLEVFAADEDLIMVTNQFEYTGPDGRTQSETYTGAALRSDSPVTRLVEMLRLLNGSHLLIDPEYGLFRRDPLLRIDRRNMLNDDQIFATKAAVAGRWGHVPEVLGRRSFRFDRPSVLARKLDVPSWQAHCANTLQCIEMLRWLGNCELDEGERRRARIAVARFYLQRQQIVVDRRGRKLLHLARAALTPRLTRSSDAVSSVTMPND